VESTTPIVMAGLLATAYIDLVQDLLSPLPLATPPPRPLLVSLTEQLCTVTSSDSLGQLVSVVLRSPALWPSFERPAFATGTAVFDAFVKGCLTRAENGFHLGLAGFVRTVLGAVDGGSDRSNSVLRLVIVSAVLAGLQSLQTARGILVRRVEDAALGLWPAVLSELGEQRGPRREFPKPAGLYEIAMLIIHPYLTDKGCLGEDDPAVLACWLALHSLRAVKSERLPRLPLDV
jgi:hypothetical protein